MLRELERRAVEDAERILEEQKAERSAAYGNLPSRTRGGQAYEHLDMTALHGQVTRWREARLMKRCGDRSAKCHGQDSNSPPGE